ESTARPSASPPRSTSTPPRSNLGTPSGDTLVGHPREGVPQGCPTRVSQLFLNQAAGDAVAGVAGWLRLVVIGLGVNHQRRTVAGEEAVRAFQRLVVREKLSLDLAVRRHLDVGQVAGVRAFGIHE